MGLKDSYDFKLHWVGRKVADTGGGSTIFTAVEKPGLRFEQRKVPLPVIRSFRCKDCSEHFWVLGQWSLALAQSKRRAALVSRQKIDKAILEVVQIGAKIPGKAGVSEASL